MASSNSSQRRHRQSRSVLAAGVLLPLLTLAVACGGSEEVSRLPAEAHVHGIGVNPADGMVYLGTHEGLYRLEVAKRKVTRVGESRDDFMAFTVLGSDWFIASGHPGTAGRPSNLGLIESRDGGRTWQEVALGGEADFHGLRVAEGTLFGYHSGGVLGVSTDGGKSWRLLAETELSDFAVDDPAIIVATPRGLSRSEDGGRSWTSLSGPRIVLLSGPSQGALWGLTGDGVAFRSRDAGTQWERLGSAAVRPTAFLAHDDAMYVAGIDGSVLRSQDGGKTWQRMLG